MALIVKGPNGPELAPDIKVDLGLSLDVRSQLKCAKRFVREDGATRRCTEPYGHDHEPSPTPHKHETGDAK